MVGGTAVCSEIGPLALGDAGFFSTVRKMRIEVGYPPYKMPEKTWPVCVQELTWPRLWENVHIWLNEVPVCIRGDQHEGKDSYMMLLRVSAYQFGNQLFFMNRGTRHVAQNNIVPRKALKLCQVHILSNKWEGRLFLAGGITIQTTLI